MTGPLLVVRDVSEMISNLLSTLMQQWQPPCTYPPPPRCATTALRNDRPLRRALFCLQTLSSATLRPNSATVLVVAQGGAGVQGWRAPAMSLESPVTVLVCTPTPPL